MTEQFSFKLYLVGIFSCVGFGLIFGIPTAMIMFTPHANMSQESMIGFVFTMIVGSIVFGLFGMWLKPMKNWINQSQQNSQKGMQE